MWEDWEKEELDEDGLVEFKGSAKAFVRTYAFLSCVLPYTNAAWEKLSIFLNFLIPKRAGRQHPAVHDVRPAFFLS